MKNPDPIKAANKAFELNTVPAWYIRDRCLEGAERAKTETARHRLQQVANVIDDCLAGD